MNHKKSEDIILEKYNGQPVIGSYKEAPSFQKDNEYIVNGYRLNHNKFSRVIKSLFTIHNETINIWSHLVGVAIFMFLMSYIAVNFTQKIIPTLKTVNVSSLNEYVEELLIDTYHFTYNALSYVWGKIHDFPAYLFSSNEESFRIIPFLPKWPLYVQIGSAIFCLLCSSTFHLFMCQSAKLSKLLSRLDYSGIAVLISGSTFPPIIYGFACNKAYKIFYAVSLSAICMGAFIFTLMPKSDEPKYRKIRGLLYIFTGLTAGIVSFHGGISSDPNIQMNTILWALGGAIYISGATLYILRFPERLAPGKFDIFGSSHQLFHFFVVLAALVHFVAAVELYHMRKAQMFCI